jgi:hypothetical protein
MSGNLAPPPFPTSGGAPVANAQAPNASPPSFPTTRASGPTPPPFPTSGGAPVPGADMADQPTAPAPGNTPQKGGLLRNVAAGALELPQEIANAGKWAIGNLNQAGAGVAMGADPSQLGTKGLNAQSVQPTNTGTVQIPGVTNFIQNTSDTSLPEQMARGAGEMLPFALAPEAGGAGLIARGAKAIGAGAVSGLGGYEGQRVGGTTGQVIGSLAGAITGQGLVGGAAHSLDLLSNAMADSLPLTAAQRATRVNQVVQLAGGNEGETAASQVGRMTAPGATVPLPGGAPGETIPLGQNGEIVPGSLPTTAQLTGNQGLANIEAARARDFSSSPLYNQRYTAQAQNRAQGMANLEPINADPSQVKSFAQETLDRINDNNDQAATAATALRNQGIQQAGGELGSEAYGADAQNALVAGHQTASALASKFWNDLDERNPTINVAPLKSGVQDITDSLAAAKRPIAPAEQSIYDRASQLNNVEPWAVVSGLRKDLGEQIRGANDINGLGTEAKGRLVQLRSALDDATSTAMDRQASEDMASNVQGPDAWANKIIAERQGWMQAKADAGQRATTGFQLPGTEEGVGSGVQGAGQIYGRGNVPGSVSARGISSASGPLGSGNGEAIRSAGNAPSPQALPGELPVTGEPWTQYDQDQYDAANAATFQKKQTFENSIIGPIVGKKGVDARLNDAQVAKQLFPGGVKSKEAAQRYFTAAGNDPTAQNLYQDLAAANFRKYAVDDNGNINTQKAASWLGNHGSGLDQSPGLRAKFETPIAAQQTLNESLLRGQQELKSFQKTELGKLVNQDPVQYMGSMLSSPDAANRAQNFMSSLGNNPGLQEASKSAMARYINSRFVQNLLTGDQVNSQITAGRLRQFLAQRSDAIGSVMGPDSVNSLRRILADFDRGNASRLGRTAGMGSPTGANTVQSAALGAPTTKLGKAISDKGGPLALLSAIAGHPYVATAIAAVRPAYDAIQGHAMAKYHNLLDDVLLNPQTAKNVLRDAPTGARAKDAWKSRVLRSIYPDLAVSADNSQGAQSGN